jgi:Tfp pilus assembly protein PilP
MKLTTGIVALAMMAGTAWGQKPSIIHNTKNALQGAQQKPAAAAPAQAGSSAAPSKAHPAVTRIAAAPAKAVPAKAAPARKEAVAPAAAVPASPAAAKADKPQEKKYSMTGKRDPFVSPVVARQTGSGCSTGKKCLDIAQIALRGVVRSDVGMIAVVTNGLNKAYFLRENDPVFNGYVVKITGDSVIFKETFQDRLGKSSTRDVVKKITTPAV